MCSVTFNNQNYEKHKNCIWIGINCFKLYIV
ncbi:hypothetical protein DCO46_06790 [Flavobacterium sp. HTF]|nr:hypothetical protein DCO46_06790 [Flavobacterium sp. HTF]